MRRAKAAPDRAVAAIVALLAAAAFAGTWSFEEVPAALMQGLGAVEWPRLICGVILLLALFLALRQPRGAPPDPIPRTGWWTLLAAVAFVPAIDLIGMLPAMLLFLVGIGWLWGERRPLVLGGSAVGVVLTIWLVFVRFFGLTLPGGLPGAWLDL